MMADAHELVSPVLQDSLQQRHYGHNSDLIVVAPHDVNDYDDVVPSDGSGDSTQRRRLDEQI